MGDEQRSGVRPIRSQRNLSEDEIGKLAYAGTGDDTPAQAQPPVQRSEIPEPGRVSQETPVQEEGALQEKYARPSTGKRKIPKSIRLEDDEAARLDRICRAMDLSESRILREITAPALVEMEEILHREGRGGVLRFLDSRKQLYKPR